MQWAADQPIRVSVLIGAFQSDFAWMADLRTSLRLEKESPAKIGTQFIVLSAVIGGGIFNNNGLALELAGPAGLITAIIAVGLLAIIVGECVAELVQQFPIYNAIVEYVRVFVDEDLAWVVGIAYWLADLNYLVEHTNFLQVLLCFYFRDPKHYCRWPLRLLGHELCYSNFSFLLGRTGGHFRNQLPRSICTSAWDQILSNADRYAGFWSCGNHRRNLEGLSGSWYQLCFIRHSGRWYVEFVLQWMG